MDNLPGLIIKANELMTENEKREIKACNDFTRRYGLSLNDAEIAELCICREKALKASGRVEFGGGVLPKLIRAFCDSPYLERDSYESTLAELQEAFYYCKTESMDMLSDDELIELMVSVFNGRAQGSVDFLLGTSLDAMCRYAKRGRIPDNTGEAGDVL